MKHTWKKAWSILLTSLLLLTFLPGVFALDEPPQTVASGYCGVYGNEENVSWTLDSAGTLTIGGTGQMDNYYQKTSPWKDYRADIYQIVIEDGVTIIGDGAFQYCINLTDISFSSTLTQIRYYAFAHCGSLTSVTIPDNVTLIGAEAFEDCEHLQSVVVGNGVTALGYSTFRFCEELTSITIGNSVEDILSGALWGTGLTSVHIPASVKKIDGAAFLDTPLENITVDENNPYFSCDSKGGLYDKEKTTLILFPIGSGATAFTIPAGVTTIAPEAFWAYSTMNEITIPEGVTTIGVGAFRYCSGLTEVVLPKSLENLGYASFSNCYNLETINIPAKNTKIGSQTFQFTKLTEVTIPDSVTEIDGYAFSHCEALTSVKLPNNVTSIKELTFNGCTKLTDITLPEHLAHIGLGAFYGCESLTELAIPETLETIENQAFYGCNALTNVYYTGSEAQWAQIEIEVENNPLLNAAIHYNCHEHSPAAAIRENETPPTCTEDGSYDEVIYCVKCNYEFSRSHVNSDAIGHNWGEWEVLKQGTVEEEGLARRVCLNNESHVQTEILPRLELDEENEPTSFIKEYVARLVGFFRGIIDWFLRLFYRW